MPKIIQTMLDVMPDQGVLIRSAYLRNDIRASGVMAEARRRASKMVAAAQNEAERIYLEAKTEGYAAGILQVAGELVVYLAAHAELAKSLQSQLYQDVEKILHRCVNDADVVMAAFEECLGEQDQRGASGLELQLPQFLRSNHRGFLTRLQALNVGPVNIEYYDDARFLLRFGDRVMEFSPDDFVRRNSLRAISSLPSIYAESRLLAEKCREGIAAVLMPEVSGAYVAGAEETLQAEQS